MSEWPLSPDLRSAKPDEMVMAPRSSLVERRLSMREETSTRISSNVVATVVADSRGKIMANSSPP